VVLKSKKSGRGGEGAGSMFEGGRKNESGKNKRLFNQTKRNWGKGVQGIDKGTRGEGVYSDLLKKREGRGKRTGMTDCRESPDRSYAGSSGRKEEEGSEARKGTSQFGDEDSKRKRRREGDDVDTT